jgi:hypothetical protein
MPVNIVTFLTIIPDNLQDPHINTMREEFNLLCKRDPKLLVDFNKVYLTIPSLYAPILLAPYCAKMGYNEFLYNILDHGANPDARCNNHSVQIVDCAIMCNQITTLKMLRSFKANCNILSPDGKSPLLLAVEKGSISLARELLYQEAKVDFGGHDTTPLHAAIEENNYPMIEFLVKNGADVNICDGGGDSALYFAALQGQETLIYFLGFFPDRITEDYKKYIKDIIIPNLQDGDDDHEEAIIILSNFVDIQLVPDVGYNIIVDNYSINPQLVPIYCDDETNLSNSTDLISEVLDIDCF